MPVFSNDSFLCAYFTFMPRQDSADALPPLGWEPVCTPAAEIENYRHYFYPGFTDFSLSEDNGGAVRRFSLKIGKTISLGQTEVLIEDLCIRLMPYGIALYSIHAHMDSDSLGDFTYALFRMREMRRWSGEDMAEFIATAIEPLKQAARAIGFTSPDIIEDGNKLKVFQIVTCGKKEDIPGDWDTTLFELGTLGKIGGCREDDPDSLSASYIGRMLDGNKLCFFNNWRGLALFDTFTMFGYGVSPWVRDTWVNDYFSMIYIHKLFCKFYLFRLNDRFRSNPTDGESLEQEYHEFERLYTFHRISYNFLPGEIDAAMDRALELSEEKSLLAGFISGYNKRQSDIAADRLDKILTFLAIVTVFSTIWDFSSMINAMWPFQMFSASTEAGFRLVVSLSILVIVLVIISMLRRRR